MSSPAHALVTATQLGSILRAARKTHGMTQLALAQRIGLSQSRVSYFEYNAHELSVEHLLTWCAVLGLELAVGTRPDSSPPSGTPTDW